MTSRMPLGLVRCVQIALILPFLALSLISPAVMPARAADGTVVLVLCTGSGPVEMVLDLATGTSIPKPATGIGTCDWSAAQSVVMDAPPAAHPSPPLTLVALDVPTLTAMSRPARAPVRPEARGPPAA